MLNNTNLENGIVLSEVYYDYLYPKETALSLIKIFGHCLANDQISSRQCLKIQSIANEFFSTFLLDFCKIRTKFKQDHLIHSFECSMGKSGRNPIYLSGGVNSKRLTLYDNISKMNIKCKALDFDEKSEKDDLFSLFCTINDSTFLVWSKNNNPLCKICDAKNNDFNVIRNTLELNFYNKTSSGLISYFNKIGFSNKVKASTCSESLNFDCFEKGMYDQMNELMKIQDITERSW